jgi:DNA-binding FadR family transcriptional regulator
MGGDRDPGTSASNWGLDASLARSPKISVLVARELAKRILEEQMEEGTPLPNESRLIEIFGVGRPTLREALRLLETRGLITIRTGPHGGPIVRRPRAEDLSDALTLMLQLEGAVVGDVLEARVATEPALARLAALRITEAQLDELDASIERMATTTQPDAFTAENGYFHRLVAEAAASTALQVFLGSLESIVHAAVLEADHPAQQRKRFVAGYRSIAAALRAHDGDGAEHAMRAQLEESTRFWKRRYAHLLARGVHWV